MRNSVRGSSKRKQESDRNKEESVPKAKLIASIEYLNSIEDILEEEMKKSNSNFVEAKRIEFSELTPSLFEREVVQNGKPLVVSGVCKNWNKRLFNLEWLKEHFGDWQMIASPRDTQALKDLKGWTIEKYIDYIKQPEDQRNPKYLYGKDVTCPDPWRKYVATKLNSYFCYEHRDLVSHLKREQQPETLMVYVGIGNTYTPGHTDICGSLGHNLLVYSDDETYVIWFITESRYKAQAAKLWGKYGSALEHDNCFLPIEKLAEADFPFHIVRQRYGDLVLVPPEAAHQVVNKGGCSIKIAWNRVTPNTIHGSYTDILPRYHEICKAEVYRIKTLCYEGLRHQTAEIMDGRFDERTIEEFSNLLALFDEIVWEETIDQNFIDSTGQTSLTKEKFRDVVPHLRTCNFCNADIFNRCYRCPVCSSDYDVCLTCIAEGRGCKHNSQLVLKEHLSMKELVGTLDKAYEAYYLLVQKAKKFNIKVKPLKLCDKKNMASVASLAYQMVERYRRSYFDIRCHQCKRRKLQNHIVNCSNADCAKAYCAMCLWNRYGIKQFHAQRDKRWKCPCCLVTCNCAACLRKRGIDPKEYEVLSVYKALLDISVVVPIAFSTNSDVIAGVCDAAPKPARSQGYSAAEMERSKSLRNLMNEAEIVHRDEEITKSPAESLKRTRKAKNEEDDYDSGNEYKTKRAKREEAEAVKLNFDIEAVDQEFLKKHIRIALQLPVEYTTDDEELRILTFLEPGVTYKEWLEAYRSRNFKRRKEIINEDRKLYHYWCVCGQMKTSSQHFAAHAKVCPIYRICSNPPRPANDPIFLISSRIKELVKSNAKPLTNERMNLAHLVNNEHADDSAQSVIEAVDDGSPQPVFTCPIFAFRDGWPCWWPAALVSNATQIPELKYSTPSTPACPVYFFAVPPAQQYYWCSFSKILSFEDHHASYWKEFISLTGGTYFEQTTLQNPELQSSIIQAISILLRSYFLQGPPTLQLDHLDPGTNSKSTSKR